MAALQSGLKSVLSAWRPAGLLSDEDQSRALAVCVQLLNHLQAYGALWCPPLRINIRGDIVPQPHPTSVTQAVLQLLARLTRKHAAAMHALSAGVLKRMLGLPAECLSPNFTRHEPAMLSIVRHMLEDPATLETWMEAEIKDFFAQRAR